MSYFGRVMANLVLKFPNFYYHGNRGCLMSISVTPFIAWPWKLPVCCKIHGSISCISRVLANFVLENHQLVTMATTVSLRVISTMPLNCPTPKTPSLVQTSCFYL